MEHEALVRKRKEITEHCDTEGSVPGGDVRREGFVTKAACGYCGLGTTQLIGIPV
jgi:hypothetical protein